MKKNNLIYASLFVSIVLLDRITKYAALVYCKDEFVSIWSFLSCHVVFNRGFSWSMFHAADTAIFFGVSSIIAGVTALVAWQAYERYCHNYIIIGELLVIAGSFSNIIDRLWYGGVLDFILLSWNQWYWPAFNIADASIVLGVCAMVYAYYE